jgi:adenylylsulfate kinase-like enzyme
MSDDLKAQASSLKAGVEQADATIERLRGELGVVEADRLDMARRLGAVERFLESEGVALPYDGKAGV